MKTRKTDTAKSRPGQRPVRGADIHLRAGLGLITIGCALLFAGFTVSPTGVIDSSVLVAFGEILTFAGAMFGIDYSFRNYEKD